jgi:molecular chaperone GrpE
MQENTRADKAASHQQTEEELEAPAAGGESSPEEELARKDAEIAELKNQLLYLRADFENAKKRMEKRHREGLEYAVEPLLRDLLPVLDSLEKAIAHAGETGAECSPALREGLEFVVSQFRSAIMNHGVEDIPADGEKFDPHVHEALVQVPGPEGNRVAEVYEKGYLLKGRLLRPTKVAVSKVATPDMGD